MCQHRRLTKTVLGDIEVGRALTATFDYGGTGIFDLVDLSGRRRSTQGKVTGTSGKSVVDDHLHQKKGICIGLNINPSL